jgi:S-adenosyl methyltransferase
LFDGLELVDPGLVYANDWRPDENAENDSPWHTSYCGGVGREP